MAYILFFFQYKSVIIIPISIILWSVMLDFTQQGDNDDDLIICKFMNIDYSCFPL